MFRSMRYIMQIGNYETYGLHNKDTLFKLFVNGKEKGFYKEYEITDEFQPAANKNIKYYRLDEVYRTVYITTK